MDRVKRVCVEMCVLMGSVIGCVDLFRERSPRSFTIPSVSGFLCLSLVNKQKGYHKRIFVSKFGYKLALSVVKRNYM